MTKEVVGRQEELEVIISELAEREEFSCSGYKYACYPCYPCYPCPPTPIPPIYQ